MSKYELEHAPPELNTPKLPADTTPSPTTPKSKNKAKPFSLKREILSWIMTLASAALIVIIVQSFIIINAFVPTGSMESTIMTGDRIIALRLSYVFSEPKRGEAVVFKYPDDETQKYTKRVIGLPGETVEVRAGKVYINDAAEPLNEPYLNEPPTGDFGPYTVPEDHYFMMGDNREKSWDSRYWKNTFVAKDKILGKVVLKYYKKPGIIDNNIQY